MIWQTHATAGANAGWIAYLSGASVETVILIAVLGAFAALLPDIDGKHAKIHNVGIGGITPLAIFRGGFKHRGFFHSLLAAVILFILLFLLVPTQPLLFAGSITIAFLSHLALDALTKSGIGFLWPINKKYRLLPRQLAWRTGRSGDFFLLLIFAAGIAGLFFVLLPDLAQPMDLTSLIRLP